MATVDGFYDISLLINEEEADLAPTNLSFEIEDSIHMLYPRMRLSLADTSGMFQEYLSTLEGLKYQLSYGNNDTQVKSRYVILADSLPETMSTGILNGHIQIDLIHEYFDQQQIISAAYEDRISLIVQKFANKYKFKEVVINDTGNQDIWYQPLITDAEMIEKVFLRYAYSAHSFNSPFFCFIDANNIFNFRNYKSLIDSTPVAELVLLPEGPANSRDPNVIRAIHRVHVGAESLGDLRRRSVFTLDYSDGSLIEKEDNIASYPSSTKKVGMIENEANPKSFLYQGMTESTAGRNQNILGEQFAGMRDTLFLDRFIVDLSLNPKLRAGKMINLDVKTFKSEQGGDSSLTYRGKYIIENAKQIWIGENQTGMTRLLISKKESSVPSTYYVGNRFMTP